MGANTPLRRGGRLLKRWRYVGAFSPELMLCAADVRIGPLRQRFFALAERDRPIATGTFLRGRAVTLSGSRVVVQTDSVALQVELEENDGVTTVHDAGRVRTRKQAGIAARVEGSVDGRRHELECRAVVDDTIGYHRRHTRWWWSAGVGTSVDGREVAWNLVAGVNDAPAGSERRLWLDGEPREVGPVRFAADLSSVEFAEGGGLDFSAWCERAARTNLLVVRSSYRQPFGSFSGTLPGAGEIAGLGVMEWHDAVW